MKMRWNTAAVLGGTILLIAGAAGMTWAGPSSEEIAKLGNELTPLGAISAGNADGSIPEWDPSKLVIPDNFVPGSDHYPNPYPDEKPLGWGIQRMRRGFASLLASFGITRDPVFGPLIMFGLGASAAARATSGTMMLNQPNRRDRMNV